MRGAGWAAAFAMTGGLAFAQGPLVPLRWAPAAERSETYDVRVEWVVDQREGEGEARRLELRQEARVTVWVDGVGEDGSASLLGRVSDVRIEWRSGETSGTSGGVGETPEDAVGKTLAGICAAAIASGLRVTLDNAGAITGFSGLERARDALAGQEVVDESALGVLDGAAMASRLARVFCADAAGVGEGLAGAGSRRVGSEWRTTERVSMGSAGELEVTTDWALREVAEGEARVEGVSSVAARRAADASPGAPVVTLDGGEGVTRAVWDLSAGALASEETEQTVTMVWTLGDLVLRQEQRYRWTLTRVREGDAKGGG